MIIFLANTNLSRPTRSAVTRFVNRLICFKKLVSFKKGEVQGSKVIQQEQIDFPVSNLTSYQELVRQHGMNSKTNVIQVRKKLQLIKKLSSLTGFPEYRLGGGLFAKAVVDGLPPSWILITLIRVLSPSISREIAEHSIYAYLEDELGLHISYAQKEITIDPATNRDKILMNIGNDHHVVSVKSKVYLADGQQFQFTDSRHKLRKIPFR